MANEQLVQAMQRVRSLGSYKGKSVKGEIPLPREVSADIKLQPLDSIKSDIKPDLDTYTLAPVLRKKVQAEINVNKPTVSESISKVNYGYYNPEPYSIINKPDKVELNWDDINDRRMLLDAQLEAESRYDPEAGSKAGAQGIAQFMPGTWKDYQNKGWVPKDKSPFDVGAALQGQRKYMERMIGRDVVSQHPDSLTRIKMALAGYNAGPQSVINAFNEAKNSGNPDEWMQFLPKKSETIPYVERVLKTAKEHKQNNYDSKYDWGYRKQGGILKTTKS